MKLGWKLLIVVVLLFSLGSLALLEDRFMGDVVWEPSTVVGNCSDVDIISLWNEVFVESSVGITILKEVPTNGDNCTQFVAIRGDGVDEIWYMLYDLSPLGFIQTDYVNVSSGLYSDIMGLDTFLDLNSVRLMLILRVDEINNESFDGSADALSFYDSKFEYSPTSLEYFSGGFSLYSSTETSSDIQKEYNVTYSVFDNKSFAGSFNSISEFSSGGAPILIEDIVNFTFEMNSSWNVAFDIADHFQMDSGVNVDFSYGGINNTGGGWINYSIINGAAQFKPATGFIGSREFRLSAMGNEGTTDSNYFTVTIVEDINYPPVFEGEIDDIFLTLMRNTTIYLGDYFEELDGTTMTYSAPGVDNVSVAFDGDDMYVWLKSGFTDFERFRIVASDGVHQTYSNRITVYLENNNSVEGDDLLDGLLNDSILVSPDGLSAPGASTNGAEDDEREDSKIGFWIMVVSGILLVMLIVGAVIYFAFFDKGPVQVPVVNTAINNYLKRINSMKDKGRY